jgi:hypothetical protein
MGFGSNTLRLVLRQHGGDSSKEASNQSKQGLELENSTNFSNRVSVRDTSAHPVVFFVPEVLLGHTELKGVDSRVCDAVIGAVGIVTGVAISGDGFVMTAFTFDLGPRFDRTNE